MTVSRRQFLGFAAAGIAGPWPLAARAEPYVNNTGLQRGQFVWEGWKATEGPVVVVVSRSAQLAHVYRGGIEIGAAVCTTGRPGRATPTGVFLVREKERRGGGKGAAAGFIWSGVALHAKSTSDYPAAYGCVRLPPDFAGLLFDIAEQGTVVIIANERTYPFDVVHPGLLPPGRGPEEARADKLAPLHHLAVATDAAAARLPAVSIVVSVSDRTAYVLRDGVVEAAVPVSVRQPEKRLGTHVYSLVGGVQDEGPLRWVAFGIGERRTEPHIASWLGTTALERVSLTSRSWPLPLSEGTRPGTTLVVTDEASPPAARATPPGFVLLASDTGPEPAVHRASARTGARAPARVARRSRLTTESLLRDY